MEQPKLTTVRLDRKTKLGLMAATIHAGSNDLTEVNEIKQAVDAALMIEAVIESRIAVPRR